MHKLIKLNVIRIQLIYKHVAYVIYV